jgi:hypothetical protein
MAQFYPPPAYGGMYGGPAPRALPAAATQYLQPNPALQQVGRPAASTFMNPWATRYAGSLTPPGYMDKATYMGALAPHPGYMGPTAAAAQQPAWGGAAPGPAPRPLAPQPAAAAVPQTWAQQFTPTVQQAWRNVQQNQQPAMTWAQRRAANAAGPGTGARW